ncbi:hypothetical protein GJ496_008569 [Pomphorhynchus laevis]|nr:hypothetical protein GJ496_008569 [Pomphorhynchus laevis]
MRSKIENVIRRRNIQRSMTAIDRNLKEESLNNSELLERRRYNRSNGEQSKFIQGRRFSSFAPLHRPKLNINRNNNGSNASFMSLKKNDIKLDKAISSEFKGIKRKQDISYFIKCSNMPMLMQQHALCLAKKLYADQKSRRLFAAILKTEFESYYGTVGVCI